MRPRRSLVMSEFKDEIHRVSSKSVSTRAVRS